MGHTLAWILKFKCPAWEFVHNGETAPEKVLLPKSSSSFGLLAKSQRFTEKLKYSLGTMGTITTSMVFMVLREEKIKARQRSRAIETDK